MSPSHSTVKAATHRNKNINVVWMYHCSKTQRPMVKSGGVVKAVSTISYVQPIVTGQRMRRQPSSRASTFGLGTKTNYFPENFRSFSHPLIKLSLLAIPLESDIEPSMRFLGSTSWSPLNKKNLKGYRLSMKVLDSGELLL